MIITNNKYSKPESVVLETVNNTLLLNNLIHRLPQLICWKNTNSVFLGCNNKFAELLGFNSPEEIIGKTDADLGWGGTEIDKAVLTTGIANNYEQVLIFPDGIERTLLTHKSPLLDKNNHIIGILVIGFDITEKRRQKETLQQAIQAREKAEISNQIKSKFIANMSHDIRTPLTGIIGMSEAIQSTTVDKKIKEYAYDVEQSAQKLLKLLTEIMEISQYELGKLPDENEFFNLKELLQDVKILVLPTVRHLNHRLEIKYDETIPPLFYGKRVLIHRIILNLLNNATKFTENGFISISIQMLQQERNQAIIKIQITDTGIGIPADKVDQIFEPFYKLSPSYGEKYKGTGLGLYIVKQFLDKLNGQIKVKSDLGKGTKMICSIPLTIASQKEIEAFSIKQAQLTEKNNLLKNQKDTQSRTKHILLVEDDNIARKVATIKLKALHHTVDHAVTGEEALEMAKATNYDLILMDIGLPNKKGNEVTEIIRQWEKDTDRPAVPIIALTAHAAKEQIALWLASGMQAVWEKPLKEKDIEENAYWT